MIRAAAVSLLLVVNLLFWGTPVLVLALVKLLTLGRWRGVVAATLWLASCWAAVNDRILDALLPTRWIVEGTEDLRRDGRYLIVSNHVSWVDVFALLRAFRGRIRFPRFFTKRELIWFPIVGQAAWGLDFPFMRRYSAEYLERHPEKRGTDLETTRRACERYRGSPVAILNFAEGTRFTREKHADQQSPYRHLLRPRAGGIAFVLASLGDQLEALLDATVAYSPPDVTLGDFLTGRLERIDVRVRRVEIPAEFLTASIAGPGASLSRFGQWIEARWHEKDALLDELHRASPPRLVTSR